MPRVARPRRAPEPGRQELRLPEVLTEGRGASAGSGLGNISWRSAAGPLLATRFADPRPTPLRRRALERDLVADAPKTHTESEHRGRIIGDMLDLREELVRTIASPWVPRMGRCR